MRWTWLAVCGCGVYDRGVTGYWEGACASETATSGLTGYDVGFSITEDRDHQVVSGTGDALAITDGDDRDWTGPITGKRTDDRLVLTFDPGQGEVFPGSFELVVEDDDHLGGDLAVGDEVWPCSLERIDL